jgi:hypothetical protein
MMTGSMFLSDDRCVSKLPEQVSFCFWERLKDTYVFVRLESFQVANGSPKLPGKRENRLSTSP